MFNSNHSSQVKSYVDHSSSFWKKQREQELDDYFHIKNISQNQKNTNQKQQEQTTDIQQKQIDPTKLFKKKTNLPFDQNTQELFIYTSLLALFGGILLGAVCILSCYCYKETRNMQSAQEDQISDQVSLSSFNFNYKQVFKKENFEINHAAVDLEKMKSLRKEQKAYKQIQQDSEQKIVTDFDKPENNVAESFADKIRKTHQASLYGGQKNDLTDFKKDNQPIIEKIRLIDETQEKSDEWIPKKNINEKNTRVWSLSTMQENNQEIEKGQSKDNLENQSTNNSARQISEQDQINQRKYPQKVIEMHNISQNDSAGGKSPRSAKSGRKSRSRSRRSDAGGKDGLDGIVEERQPSPQRYEQRPTANFNYDFQPDPEQRLKEQREAGEKYLKKLQEQNF